MAEAQNEVVCVEQNRAGIVRFTRPQALNALSQTMINALEPFYIRCGKNPRIYAIVMEAEGKAFCSGGDIRALYDFGREKPAEALHYYGSEYQHNWTLECLAKPNLALIDGIIMGGGVGVCLYGTHRAMTETVRFAMPETGIGFFPDVGASWFLPRLPGKTGLYLGLTGTIIGQADAFYLGLATHCIAAESFPAIKAGISEGEPIDDLLAQYHKAPGVSEIETLRAVIDRAFLASSVEEIIAHLQAEKGEHQAWAEKTLNGLARRSPFSLKVTFEQLRRGAGFTSLRDALIMEYRMAKRFIAHPDLYEGIRAAIVDKDKNPRWQHKSLADVSEAEVQAVFAPLEEGDIDLKNPWPKVA